MTEERRKRTLTEEDIVAIGDMISLRPICALGLTTGDATTIKSHLRIWKKATSIVGTVILTAIAIFLVGIFSKGFWVSLIEGVKK